MSAGYNGGHKRQKEVILMAGFHDIIGHDDIIRHLKNAIETGKVSHSYIFTGEPGSGKKLLAGTFAAALQCESGESEPCMTCDSCKKVIGKNHPDIITVTHEKPGSISIDEVRDQVVRDVDIKPYCSPYKIYIIPDAEMMTVQAQNALFLPLCRVSAACFITHPHGFLSLPEKAKTPDDSWAFLMFCDVLCAHAFSPLFWRSPVAAPYRSWVTVGATLGCRPNLPGV